MNQKIQLYIENEQVDVFQDGTINLVSSIKDFRSPDKLFTDFSRNFSLPASANNNKVFKHFFPGYKFVILPSSLLYHSLQYIFA